MKVNDLIGLAVVLAFVSVRLEWKALVCSSQVRYWAQAAPFLEVPHSHINTCTYLGLGTRSSGTGVQVESGDFCSLNLPVKTLAMSRMS